MELAIESVGGRGDGVAAGPVYVPFTLPGERVRARLAGERGELLEVLAASPERITPVSPHYGECGGCALQHWAHAPYLAWKREQVRLALARERIETEILPSVAAPPGSRRRLALHARRGTAEAARIGFKARGGWRLVEVEVCPIADPRLQAAFPGLRRLAAPLFEHPKSAPTLHVTWTDTGLDVDITGVERRSGGLSADSRLRVAEAAQALDAARVTLAGELLFGQRPPLVRFGKAVVALPPGGFLQAAPQAEAAMAAFIAEALGGAVRVADLFCGAGTFTFPMAEATPVHAADGAPDAVGALAAAAVTPGLKPITTEVRDLFREPLSPAELRPFDAAVFDPPRAGAAEQAHAFAASGLTRVVGVSCNPSTFARDARALVDGGFRLERVLPVDQFLWSPHVELVGLFAR
ncbi:MAG TPA: RNA methyltransferase [Caulobacteraceae bacterium]